MSGLIDDLRGQNIVQAGQWQPIETALHNATVILFLERLEPHCVMVSLGSWTDKEFIEKYSLLGLREGWNVNFPGFVPTYWMPFDPPSYALREPPE